VRTHSDLISAFASQTDASLAVLKQVHPDTGISNRAMSILNSFVNGKFKCTNQFPTTVI
jgi:hypothetical protein